MSVISFEKVKNCFVDTSVCLTFGKSCEHIFLKSELFEFIVAGLRIQEAIFKYFDCVDEDSLPVVPQDWPDMLKECVEMHVVSVGDFGPCEDLQC